MDETYSKIVTVAPGVTLTVHKKGMNAAFGVRSASITNGKNGTYLNTGVPGTGIYSRRKINNIEHKKPDSAGSATAKKDKVNAKGCGIFTLIAIIAFVIFVLTVEYKYPFLVYTGWLVGSAVVGFIFFFLIPAIKGVPSEKKIEQSIHHQIEIAQDALEQASDPIQKEILQNFITCMELSIKIDETEAIIVALKKKFEKKSDSQLDKLLKKYETELLKITDELDRVQLDADKNLDESEKKRYAVLCEDFEKILSCKKIWLVTSSVQNDELKSSASTIVERKEINFDVGVFNYIKSAFDIPMLRDLSGNIYYIYPQYIIKARSFTDFEVFPVETIDFKCSKQRFIENGIFPDDAHIADYTWQYVNEDGSQDKTNTNNPRVPVVEYGKIGIEELGLTYYISNYSAADAFVNTYNSGKSKSPKSSSSGGSSAHQQHEQQQTIISKDYFTNITQEVEKIISLYKNLCNNNAFLKEFNDNAHVSEIAWNEIGTDTKEQIKALFCFDLTKCFLDLGHEFDLKSKEGFGLHYFFARTTYLDKIEYEDLHLLRTEETYQTATNFLTLVKNTIKNPTDDIFWISEIIGQYDTDLRQRFMGTLYRYVSLTAKADGIITETEQKWLSELLKWSNKNSTQNKEKEGATTSDPQAELQSLTGLTSVKTEITTLTNFIKIQLERQAKGLKVAQPSYHCVFTGNPGTGKTTVARIVADIYRGLGILTKGHLVETDRAGLVAEYVGQTAVKTNKIIDSALDGILFIDEAYSLVGGGDNDYGKEAIATLLKRMEDNRDRLVVIIAGYSKEMQTFIDANPGLQSRFNRYIEFPDYSAEELYQIFDLNLRKFDYTIAPDAVISLKEYLTKAVANKDKHFGNARFVRNLFEKTIEQQANRLSKEVNLTNEKLSEICTADIPM